MTTNSSNLSSLLWYDNQLANVNTESENFEDEAGDRESFSGYVALQENVAVTFENGPKFMSSKETEEALLKCMDLKPEKMGIWKAGAIYDKEFGVEPIPQLHLTVMDCENDNYNYSFHMKGKAEKVLSQCSTIYVDGVTKDLDEVTRKNVIEMNAKMFDLSKGSVFAFADRNQVIQKEWEELKAELASKTFSISETGWRLIGMVAVQNSAVNLGHEK